MSKSKKKNTTVMSQIIRSLKKYHQYGFSRLVKKALNEDWIDPLDSDIQKNA
jgi:hypothetical protein